MRGASPTDGEVFKNLVGEHSSSRQEIFFFFYKKKEKQKNKTP
jgi:hypothetical protein